MVGTGLLEASPDRELVRNRKEEGEMSGLAGSLYPFDADCCNGSSVFVLNHWPELSEEMCSGLLLDGIPAILDQLPIAASPGGHGPFEGHSYWMQ